MDINQNEILQLVLLVNDIPTSVDNGNQFAYDCMYWSTRATNVIEHVYGKDSNELAEFLSIVIDDEFIRLTTDDSLDDPKNLSGAKMRLAAVLGKANAFLTARIAESGHNPETTVFKQGSGGKVFIAHDGPTGARTKLEEFLRALGFEPVTADGQPNLGRVVDRKVEDILAECDFAIAIATAARASTQDNKKIARANVVNELPRIRNRLGDKWIILLEHGVELPSNEDGWVYERFTSGSMDQSFTAIARELRGHGLVVSSS